MFVHGRHPFPEDMERMILRLHAIDRNRFHYNGPIGYLDLLDWEAGENLDAGREKLKRLLAEYDPDWSEIG